MTEQPDPITQAAAEAVRDADLVSEGMATSEEVAEAVVAAVTPLIRQQIANQIEESDVDLVAHAFADTDGYRSVAIHSPEDARKMAAEFIRGGQQ